MAKQDIPAHTHIYIYIYIIHIHIVHMLPAENPIAPDRPRQKIGAPLPPLEPFFFGFGLLSLGYQPYQRKRFGLIKVTRLAFVVPRRR